MRYPQSKEQSAELLRIVLARMGQHDAAFTPLTYAVWYEYAAGVNAGLNQALDQLLKVNPRLSDADVRGLYETHVADVDPQAMHRIGGELQRVMATMAAAAARTGDDAGEFGTQLEALVTDLQVVNDQLLSPAFAQAMAGTVRMRSSVQSLETEVKGSQNEIERLHEELIRVRDESMMDALTQVLNRKGFDQKLADMLARTPQAGHAHSLVMFDIDRFKQVNDSHGHVMGDRVLQAVGEVLKSCVPPGSGVSVARYGGEEFVLLLPDSQPHDAFMLAELARTRTKALKIRDRRTKSVVLTVTVSGGVAQMLPGDDAQSLIARADAALYQSKQTGRDRVTCA